MGAFVAPIIAGLGAITGLFGGSKTKSSSNTSSTTAPNFTGPQQDLINQLLSSYKSQISGAPTWNQAYETSGASNILKNALRSSQGANDILAQRGISRTTAGGQALNDQSQQQGSQLASFLNNAPIAEQANLSSLESGAGSFLSSLPVGSTTNSSMSGVNVGGQPTSPIAGLLSGGATSLAGILGQQSAQASFANILKGLALPSDMGASAGLSGAASSLSSSLGSDTGGWF